MYNNHSRSNHIFGNNGDTLYRYISNSINDFIIVFDPETEEILEANRACLSFYGYSKKDFLGRTLLDFSKDPENGKKGIDTVLRNGEIKDFHTTHLLKCRKEISLKGRATLLNFNNKAAILSVYSPDSNIKKRQEIEKKRFLNFVKNNRIEPDFNSVNLNLNLFNELDEKSVEKITNISSTKKFSKNEIIYMEGEPSNFIFLLKSGRVKLAKYHPGDSEKILTLINPGGLFGELTYIGSKYRPGCAIALENSTVYSINKKDFIELVESDKLLDKAFTNFLITKVYNFKERIGDLLYKETDKRIISTLLWLIKYNGKIINNRGYLEPFLIHRDIADLAACSRQSVNNLLTTLRKENIIEFNHARLMVPDIKKLENRL